MIASTSSSVRRTARSRWRTRSSIEAVRAAGNVVMGTTEIDAQGRPSVFFFEVDVPDEDVLAYSRAVPAN